MESQLYMSAEPWTAAHRSPRSAPLLARSMAHWNFSYQAMRRSQNSRAEEVLVYQTKLPPYRYPTLPLLPPCLFRKACSHRMNAETSAELRNSRRSSSLPQTSWNNLRSPRQTSNRQKNHALNYVLAWP